MRRRCQNRGFTLIEVLMALAVTALLMAGFGVAVNASMTNYQENNEIYEGFNAARQALARMTTELRTGDSVDPSAPANQCNFFTASGQDTTYEYRSTDHTLYLITNSDGEEYTLCRNVQAMIFDKTLTDDGLDCTSVRMTMTIQNGNQPQTLSTSVVIRRNLD